MTGVGEQEEDKRRTVNGYVRCRYSVCTGTGVDKCDVSDSEGR